MIFSRFRITRKVAFIVFFLMVDFVFNYGVTPCNGYHLQPKENSSTGTQALESNLINDYFKSVLNKSRVLEEAIFSDVLNNLRNLLKTENNQSVESGKKEHESYDARGRNEEVECKTRNKEGNKTNVIVPANLNKTSPFLSAAVEVMSAKGGRPEFGNVTMRDPAQEKKYFLGYSGNPFGSQHRISGVVEVPEIDFIGRGVADPRKKRSVLHLYNMVLCTTGCNPFAYKGYGCYCGFLGSGFVVDGIDSCCKMHDWCYNSAGCPMFLEYFVPYLWQCHRHQPLCAIDHGYYGGPGSCSQRLCECDRQLALCLRRYPCPSSKALCTSSPWSKAKRASKVQFFNPQGKFRLVLCLKPANPLSLRGQQIYTLAEEIFLMFQIPELFHLRQKERRKFFSFKKLNISK